MALRISTERGDVELGKDFTMDMEIHSPITSEEGNQSVSVSVPYTPVNARIFGHAERMDMEKAPLLEDNHCSVIDGSWSQKAVINLLSASRSEGYEFNVGFDNSVAYGKWKETRMCDLPTADEIATDGVVAGSFRTSIQITEGEDGGEEEEPIPPVILQQPVILVWKALELAFDSLGYTIEDNFLKHEPNLSRVVLLNNVVDKSGKYADLLPTSSVSDFFATLYARFGLIYSCDTNRRSVSLALIRDVLESVDVKDIEAMLEGYPKTTFAEPTYLKLSNDTGLEKAVPLEPRWEDILVKYDATVNAPSGTSHVNYSYETNQVVLHSTKYGDSLFAPNFSWNPQPVGIEATEIASPDKGVYIEPLGSGTILKAVMLTGKNYRHKMEEVDKPDDETDETPIALALMTENGLCLSSGGFGLTWQFDDGLYSRYWRTYDDILRRSMHEVEVPVTLSGSLPPFTAFDKLTLNGQPLILDKLSYALPAKEHTPATLTMRTLRLIDNGVPLVADDDIPKPALVYYWKKDPSQISLPNLYWNVFNAARQDVLANYVWPVGMVTRYKRDTHMTLAELQAKWDTVYDVPGAPHLLYCQPQYADTYPPGHVYTEEEFVAEFQRILHEMNNDPMQRPSYDGQPGSIVINRVYDYYVFVWRKKEAGDSQYYPDDTNTINTEGGSHGDYPPAMRMDTIIEIHLVTTTVKPT